MVPTSSLTPVLVDNHCIGHVLDRGRAGFQAFDASDQSIGTFATAADAVQALIAAASTPPEAA
jgi:hypothetical protein